MNNIISLDGIKLKIELPDVDGDGETGGIENIQRVIDEGIQPILQTTELGDSLKQLNFDEIEPHTRMSGIDMRSRLHSIEVNSIVAFDSLVALKIIPTHCLTFTRQKKRLSVSIKGLGRQEIVDVVGRKNDKDANNSGFGDKVKDFMSLNK